MTFVGHSLKIEDILGQSQVSKNGVSFQVYKQACVQPPLFVGTSLVVQGVKVKIDSHGKGGKMSKSYSKFFQNYYPTSPLGGDGSTPTKDANGKVRLSPSQDDLKAMMAQAHRSVYRYEQIPLHEPFLPEFSVATEVHYGDCIY